MVERHLELAQHLARRVDAAPDLARLAEVPLCIVCLRYDPGGLGEAELDSFLDKLAPKGPAGTGGVLAEAKTLEEDGELDQAVALLRDHLRTKTDDVEARVALAELLIQNGKPTEARKVYEKLSAEEREGEGARAVAARLTFAETAGDLEQLQTRAQAEPDDPNARLGFGKALVAAQEYERGLEQLLEMLSLQAELLELKADPTLRAKGVVIEASLSKGRGPVATVFIPLRKEWALW